MKYYLGTITHGEITKGWLKTTDNRRSSIKLIQAENKEEAEVKLRLYAIENSLKNFQIKIQDTL